MAFLAFIFLYVSFAAMIWLMHVLAEKIVDILTD